MTLIKKISGAKIFSAENNTLLVCLFVWLFLVAWRPFFFGFYHDDWTAVVMPIARTGSFVKELSGDPSRPLYILILHVFRFLYADSHFAWQATCAVLQLMCAVAMIYATKNVNHFLFNKQVPLSSGLIAGIFWLIFPWSLGYSAWPVMVPPLFAMFCSICAIALALSEETGLARLFGSIALLAVSWCIYEASWFFWIPISSILLLKLMTNKRSLRPGIIFFGASFLVQCIFVVANRLLSIHSGKKIATNLLPLFESDVYLFKNELLPSLSRGRYWIACGLVGLLFAFLFNRKKAGSAFYALFAFPIFLLGILVSITLYAFAGYSIQWLGLFSRVTLPIDVWLTLIIGTVFSLAWSNAAKKIRSLTVVSVLMIAIPLTVTLIKQSKFWAKSWSEQKELIEALPAEAVNLSNGQTLILADIPRGTGPVYTFDAFWDISAVIAARMPNWDFSENKPTHAFASVLRRHEWRTTWDGTVVKQYWCREPDIVLWGLGATELYIWKHPGDTLIPVKAPFESGCSGS